ncbi:hypothetical protein [Kutzneria sp. NPDC051319]|uniref:hypothetical protein n=1 Tax=Kutzneria sp. NPDC051319 TaxID=3155047 RepID=UPI003420D767
MARVGSVDDGLWRAFFQLDVKAINGSKVHGAEFHIPPDRARPCVPAQVDLWAARPIDPGKPLTWNNSKNYWLGDGPLATAVDPDCGGRLEFSTDALAKLAQQAAGRKTGVVTVGLRAHDESAPGLALQPADPHYPVGLSTVYNNAPTVTTVAMSNGRPCGTAAAPTLVAGVRQFSARVADVDSGDLDTVRLEVLRPDGTIVHAAESGSVPPGTAFSWPELPAGTLTDGPVYHYHAQARDALDTGPSTSDCYFTVDSVRPHTPTVSSTDFPPEGEPAIMARTTGTVTVRLAGGDTDVDTFLWGTQQDSLFNRIAVGPDGTATVPVTVADYYGGRF